MQVFLSYVDADERLAKQLADVLREGGFSVLHPGMEVYPGDNWEKYVGAALEQAEIMIVLVTRNARGSSTILRHVQFALTSSFGNYHARVIPVIVDMPTISVDSDVPWILFKLNPEHVDTTTENYWQRVLDRASQTSGEFSHAAS